MKKNVIRLFALILVALILLSSFAIALRASVFAEELVLPDFIDNSQSPYFPVIDSQEDLGACVSWGQTYYQFTYMMNRSMGVPTTPENTFSPSFNFNIINGGRGTGAWDKDGYNIMKEIGSVPLSTVPYNTKEWNNWFATEQVWKEAIQYRIKDYTYLKAIGADNTSVTSPDDSDLTSIKELLSQGEVLGVTTPIHTWKVVRIKAHPDVPENDKYEDEYIVRFCDKSGQGHRLALVGYNDNIWTDVNDNGKVDSGEMGAFKVANSWGTERHNKGFMWIAYDALNMTSCVKDCPVSGNYRPECLFDFVSIEVIPYNTDADLYLRYTLNTADRSQGKVYVTARKGSEEYTCEVGVKRQHGMTFNKYSYDGTTNANDGTMLYALSNIVPGITPETLHEYVWSIKFEDTNSDGKAFTVKNMEIVDESTGRVSKLDNIFPIKLDGSQKTVNFPQFEEFTPVTATTAPATTVTQTTEVPATSQIVTTDPVENTTVAETTTVPVTTIEPVTTTVISTDKTVTEPQILTTQVEITTLPSVTTTAIIPEITTAVSTQFTTEPEIIHYLYGDANNDSSIKITDATIIQKYAAYLVDAGMLNLTNADCNKDTKVSIKDVSCIQKYLAKLDGYEYVGEYYTVAVTSPVESTSTATNVTTTVSVSSTAVTEPTEETVTSSVVTEPTETTASVTIPETTLTIPTEAITAIVTTTATPTTHIITTDAIEVSTTTEPIPVVSNVVDFTNSYGWQGTISCYYWSDSNQTMISWPGVKMQSKGNNDFGEAVYTLEIPSDATYVIFTNGSIQTVDIPYIDGEQRFYPVSPNNEGKYSVENW
ncbi:MAG: starch-binding protein [Clostridia bacterium]|nr:starch-binding protein [Clostridia bacterium]